MAENLAKPVSYEGGCHCGAVRFRVRLEKNRDKQNIKLFPVTARFAPKKDFYI